MLLPSRRLIGGVAFTLLLIGLIAFATAEAVNYFFVVMPVAVAACVAFFFIVFPGRRFLPIAFANYIGVYACVFAFFKEANFAPLHGWPVAIGFLMPVIAFLAGTWIRRDRILGVVTSDHVRDGRRLYRILAWLLPVGAVGVASFFLPALALGEPAWDASLLVAMGLIAVVVFAVSRDVCVFLLDTGLLFEEFFERKLGINFADVLHRRNVLLPTVHLESDFRRRLRYGDRIDMEVRVLRMGRTSITWGYRGYRIGEKEELVVEGKNVTVCVTTETFQKIAVPTWLREKLGAYQEETSREDRHL